MVKDLNSESGSSSPDNLTIFNNELYFSANDGTGSIGLWKSDGTEEGTILVKNIALTTDYPTLNNFTIFNNDLYLVTMYEMPIGELWKSDGTTEGTVIVGNINPGGHSNPDNLTIFNNELYFSADDGTNGSELWKISILLEDEGGEGSSEGSGDSKSLISTIKKSSQALNPNVVPGWKHPIMAGPNRS